MKTECNKSRIWELDFFRGIALMLMIYFHIVYDMREIFSYDIVYSSGINYYIGKISAITFILISGISSNLSRSNIKRGLKVLSIAMVISVVSWLYNPDLAIKFGILHFLGLSMIIYPFLQKLDKYALLITGSIIIASGNILSRINAANDYFFILGLTSDNFFSADYYPLIPWFGVFLFGASAGKILYSNRKSLFKFNIKDNLISIGGRHTLLIYLIHQPVTIIVLTIINELKQ